MRLTRWMTGIGLGTLAVAGLFVAPALQAQENRVAKSAKRQASGSLGGLGTFTPAAADPKLAAALARSGLPDSGFRFTPSESMHSTAPAAAPSSAMRVQAPSAGTAS